MDLPFHKPLNTPANKYQNQALSSIDKAGQHAQSFCWGFLSKTMLQAKLTEDILKGGIHYNIFGLSFLLQNILHDFEQIMLTW